MSVPTHGPFCHTTTYPTKCPLGCGKVVFFFSCSCQSAVFFDALGEPWPEHHCPVQRYHELREGGQSARDAEFNVLIESRRAGRTVPEHVSEVMRRDTKVEDARRASPKKTIYAEVSPDRDRDFAGTVMAVERTINMPKHFGYDPNRRARQFLGRLGKGRWHRIRCREHAEEGQEIVAEVLAFVPAREVSKVGLREGHKILISIEPYVPPAQEPVWVVRETTVRH